MGRAGTGSPRIRKWYRSSVACRHRPCLICSELHECLVGRVRPCAHELVFSRSVPHVPLATELELDLAVTSGSSLLAWTTASQPPPPRAGCYGSGSWPPLPGSRPG